MKRVFALLIFTCPGLSLFSQIKINALDMPKAGDMLFFSTANDSTINPLKTGANFTWDFSKLKPVTNDTMKYAKPAGIYALAFAGTISEQQGGGGAAAGFTFYSNGTKGWQNEGRGIKIPVVNLDIPLRDNNPELVYKFPLTYDSAFTDTFTASTSIQGFSITVNGRRTSKVDGWGKIITPFGKFDCIRVKSFINEIDTILLPFDNSRVEFTWLAKGMKLPVLQITIPKNQMQPPSIMYRDSQRVIINPDVPIPDFTVQDTSVNQGDTVLFTNLTTGMGQYQWEFTPNTVTFPPGNNRTSANPKVMFNTAGKYTVSLRVTTPQGTNQTIKINYILVKAISSPVADFTASKLLTFKGDTITLIDKTTPSPKQWLWTILPTSFTYVSGTQTSQNPVIRFDQAGIYSVNLKATNAAGSSQNYKSNFIVISNNADIKNITEDQISIYPNPVKDILHINLSKNGPGVFSIYDISGKLILLKTVKESSSIDLSSMNPGLYTIHIISDNQSFSQLIEKQ